MALVAEAAAQGHRGRRLAAPERPARGAEAPVEEIGVRRKPGLAAEGADEVGPRQAGDTDEIEKVDVRAFAIMWGSLLDGLVVQVALDDPVVDYTMAQKVAMEVADKELGLGRSRRTAKKS